jgi:replicative DNA helicase
MITESHTQDAFASWQESIVPPGVTGVQALSSVLKTILAGNSNPLVETINFGDFELGPGMVTVMGAPPASGKTTLAMQLINEAIEMNGDAIGYVLNCEMSPKALMLRELSRITGISQRSLRFGLIGDEDRQLIADAIEPIQHRYLRLRFVPGDASGIGSLASARPGIVLVDYLQRFNLGGGHDARANVNSLMAYLRQLADLGHAVLAISATKRSADGKHDQRELSLSSFRESGEVEYAADACYLLKVEPANESGTRRADLTCVKNRNGEPSDLTLLFDPSRMQFTADHDASAYEWDPQENGNPFGGED